jgi:hypothetical protein
MLARVFGGWVEVLTRPSVATFENREAEADLGSAILGVVIAGVIAGAISGFFVLVGGFFSAVFGGGVGAAARGVGGSVETLIKTPVSLLITLLVFSALMVFVARFFGGRGDYRVQTYLISLFIAPLAIISAVFSWIWVIGGIVGFAIFIYEVVLTTFAVMAAQRLTVSQSVVTWLVSGVGLLIVLGVLSAIYAAFSAIFGVTAGMFSMFPFYFPH